MDMDVDTERIELIRVDLKKCSNYLVNSANRLSHDVNVAGQSLEGRQYSLSVQETSASCNILDETTKNITKLDNHLIRLEEIVKKYLTCVYNGENV